MANYKEPTNKFNLNDILSGLHPTYQTNKLKDRLLRECILENRCTECGITDSWNNKKLTLQLDHINGISTDHRLDNLRMICPNCHSQTETFTGKNKLKPRVVSVKGKIIQKKKENLQKRLSKITDLNKRKVEILLSSDIDFTVFGWKTEAAKIIDITPQKVTQWINKNVPELMMVAFTRKSPKNNCWGFA